MGINSLFELSFVLFFIIKLFKHLYKLFLIVYNIQCSKITTYNRKAVTQIQWTVIIFIGTVRHYLKSEVPKVLEKNYAKLVVVNNC